MIKDNFQYLSRSTQSQSHAVLAQRRIMLIVTAHPILTIVRRITISLKIKSIV
jgi:hypothetical protein